MNRPACDCPYAHVCMHADALTPHDFGLDAKMPFFRGDPDGGCPKVTYLHFADAPQFTVKKN